MPPTGDSTESHPRARAAWLYAIFWLAISAGVVVVTRSAGYPLSAGIVAALLVHQAGSALFSYWARRRRARLEGMPPPTLMASAFPATDYRQEVRVPRLTRILLGLVILPFGLAMAAVGGWLAIDPARPLPWDGLVFAGVVVLLGIGIAWVGFRLLVVKDREALLRGTGLRQ